MKAFKLRAEASVDAARIEQARQTQKQTLLNEALALGALRSIDISLASCMHQGSQVDTFLTLLVSWAVSQGHGVVPLAFLSDFCWMNATYRPIWFELQAFFQVDWTQEQWRDYLSQRDFSALADHASQAVPMLVYQGDRLGLRRFWWYEQQIFKRLTQLRSSAAFKGSPQTVGNGCQIDHLTAALLRYRMLCVTGGPGTGKTTLIRSILSDYCQYFGHHFSVVRLAAPTGRGVQRLKESLTLHSDPNHWRVTTLHQLLGISSTRPEGRFHAGRPLPAALIVVDEASMVNTELFYALAQSLLPDAQLILVGDPDQLPPVEAGSTFRSLVRLLPDLQADTGFKSPCEGARRYQLIRPKRFVHDSPIHQLANLIQLGRTEALLSLLSDLSRSEGPVRWVSSSSCEALLDHLLLGYADYFQAIQQNQRVTEIEKRFKQFRCLTALYQGDRGVTALNQRLVQRIRARWGFDAAREGLFLGAPLMLLENDWGLQLANGDIGFLGADRGERILNFSDEIDGIQARKSQESMLSFPDGPSLRQYHLSQLNHLQVALVSTVHKAQGSEFDEVAIILPPEGSPVISRAWLYTAVTRARARLTIFGSADDLCAAIEMRQDRYSFLDEWSE